MSAPKSLTPKPQPKKRARPVEMPINLVKGNNRSLYEQLPYSMSLKGFLDHHPKTARFALGHWLSTLDNHTLDALLEAYRVFSCSDVNDPVTAPVRNDLLTLLFTALLAERQVKSLNERARKMPAHIDSLGVALRVESWRRKGWVEVNGDLAILQRRPATVTPTSVMRDQAPDLYRQLVDQGESSQDLH